MKFELTAVVKDKRGRILSIGKNSYSKTHPIMYKIAKSNGILDPKKIYLHAEVDAILKCKCSDKAYRLEVYRLNNKRNKHMKSKPCEICSEFIAQANIKEIVYYIDNEELVVEHIV
jgi:deoxycytidylate deaminase